ncbi:MAG: NAD(P)-dependent oxidoreductase [Pseudomonadota bacterium]
MKVAVFGGAGFLGSHVADALTDAGHDVVVCDIKKSSCLRNGQKMVVLDILDQEAVGKAVRDCDIVYNFAGIADIDEASQKPMESIRINVLGNTVLLEACRKAKIKRFVYASTLYVYSKSGSFYRSTKQACELIIENYYEVYGLPYTILRFGSLYGPRADQRNFIYRTIKEAITSGRIIREGDGEEIREYIHVFDAAKNSVEILHDEFINQHVIITGYQQMKVKDLLMMLKEMLDDKVEIQYLPIDNKYHYEITPYTFAPKLAKRIVSKTYLDIGQGILKCIQNIYKEINTLPTYDGLIVDDGDDHGYQDK